MGFRGLKTPNLSPEEKELMRQTVLQKQRVSDQVRYLTQVPLEWLQWATGMAREHMKHEEQLECIGGNNTLMPDKWSPFFREIVIFYCEEAWIVATKGHRFVPAPRGLENGKQTGKQQTKRKRR